MYNAFSILKNLKKNGKYNATFSGKMYNAAFSLWMYDAALGDCIKCFKQLLELHM